MIKLDSMWDHKIKSIIRRFCLAGLFLGFVFLVVYRYCEQAGTVAQKSCVTAMIGSVIAGMAVFGPVLGSLCKDSQKLILNVFIAGVIRLLIGFVVVVIIFLFVTVSRNWFLGCYGIFYTAFVMVDTWLIVHLFQGRPLEKDDSKYENEYRAACKRKRSRRDYQ